MKVILTGGEVMMREDFADVLKFADSMGIYVQVLTNGTLVSWTDKAIHDLSPYIDEVQVSIDGYDEESNAEIRGRGNFSAAMRTLDAFTREKDILVSAIMTPSYDSLENHREDYAAFMKGLTEKYRGRNFLAVIQRELIDGRNLRADSRRNKMMNDIVSEIYEEVYENSELTTFVMNHRDGRIFRNCGYGNLTVSARGDVCFCGRVYDVRKYANIRDTSIDEIMRLRKSVRHFTSVDYVEPCRDCDLKYVCGGGCRVKNFPESVIAGSDDFGRRVFTRATECSNDDKDRLYRLMIESNKFLMR